jgi:hypothetical protein
VAVSISMPEGTTCFQNKAWGRPSYPSILVVMRGLKPLSPSFGGRRSIRLSYMTLAIIL